MTTIAEDIQIARNEIERLRLEIEYGENARQKWEERRNLLQAFQDGRTVVMVKK